LERRGASLRRSLIEYVCWVQGGQCKVCKQRKTTKCVCDFVWVCGSESNLKSRLQAGSLTNLA